MGAVAGVTLTGVSKRFGDVSVLDRIDLDVADREFMVLVGPSGCGKSTALRLIAGLEEATEGEIAIGGRSVDGVAPRERDIAMVFQSYALYPHMTIRENLEFGLRMRKTPRPEIDRLVAEAGEILGLAPLFDRLPKQLSGGQRQRVALGRAIVRKPAVFLFDEPLSNLDARLRVQMRGEIHRLHQRLGTTMVYVTHDQVEAMTLGQRIAVLKDGVLQQVADPHTLYHRPGNRFVAGFLGSPPMNFLEAQVGAEGAVTLAGASLAAPPAPAGLTARRGGAVTLGVRPEDLTLAAGGAGGTLAATLDVHEPLGNESLLYWRTEAGPVVSRVPGDTVPAEGEQATLHFRYDRLRWFDPESGAALES